MDQQQYKIKGIVISSIDYKDKDKLITIYSLEFGKVTATLRGVKNKNAKLKFAGQLFCFADFMLVKSGEYFIVTNAEQIESFYELTSNYDNFLIGQAVLECINQVMQPRMINESLFVITLKALNVLSHENVSGNSVLIKFLLNLFQTMGYKINFDRCTICNMPLKNNTYFNFDDGFITCKVCHGISFVELNPKNFTSLKLIDNAELDNILSVKVDSATEFSLLKTLYKNFELRFGKKIKTIDDFILN